MRKTKHGYSPLGFQEELSSAQTLNLESLQENQKWERKRRHRDAGEQAGILALGTVMDYAITWTQRNTDTVALKA